MRLLLWVTVAVIIYGSFYPFGFDPAVYGASQMRGLDHSSGFSDDLTNVILFVPVGLASAWQWLERRWSAWAVAAAVLGGVTLAWMAQFGQLWLPERVPSWGDVAHNLLGLLLGLALAWPLRRFPALRRLGAAEPAIVALIAAFLVYRLSPFVPGWPLDRLLLWWRTYLIEAPFVPVVYLLDVIRWYGAAGLILGLSFTRRNRTVLFFLAVLLVQQPVMTWHAGWFNAAGAVTGIAMARLLPPDKGWRAALPGSLLLALLLWTGLTPWSPRPSPAQIELVPFGALIRTNAGIAVKVLAEKIFLFGAILVYAARAGAGRWTAAAALAAIALGIEIAQRYTFAGTPELTDPLIVLICAVTLRQLRHGRSSQGRYSDMAWRPQSIPPN